MPLPSRRGATRNWLGWLIFAFCCIALFLLVSNRHSDHQPVPFSTFREELLAGNVLRVTLESDTLIGQFRKPVSTPTGSVTLFRTGLPPGVSGQWNFLDWLSSQAHGATVDVNNAQSDLLSILIPVIPWLLIFGFLWFFIFRKLHKIAPQSPALFPPQIP